MSYLSSGKKMEKGMAKICILEILEHASEDQPLTQDAIREKLRDEFGIEVDRKTVHRHLSDLIANVDTIRYKETEREIKGEKSFMYTDFWLEKENLFEPSELQAIICSVLFSRHIPVRYKQDILKRLGQLSPMSPRYKMSDFYIEGLEGANHHNQLFLNIEILNEAIAEKRQVAFNYSTYRVDKRLHKIEELFNVSPLGLVASNNDYYLVGILHGVEDTSARNFVKHLHEVIEAVENKEVRVDMFRLDKILDIQIIDEQCSVPKDLKLKGFRKGKFNLQEYAQQNPFFKSGHSVDAEMRISANDDGLVNDVLDYFGPGKVSIKEDQTEGNTERLLIKGKTNNRSLWEFVLLHAPKVELLEPVYMRDDLIHTLGLMLKRMGVAIDMDDLAARSSVHDPADPFSGMDFSLE